MGTGRLFGLLLLLLLLSFLLACGAPARSLAATADMSAADVASWADPLFSGALTQKRLSGAVVSVVRGDRTIFTRGYGSANLAKGDLVDPDATRFRIGSATKTFTAIAIAQLLKTGAVRSLSDPANLYVQRAQLPDIDGKPVTVRQLLSHSAGFADSYFNLGMSRVDARLPLDGKAIERRFPGVIRPLTRQVNYSNFGTAWLALIVEDVSGLTIDRYFEQHIFMPLGMVHSSLNTAVAAPPGEGTPYAFFPDGTPQRVERLGIHPFFAAAGSIDTTANDMARYLRIFTDPPSAARIGLDADDMQRLVTPIAGNASDPRLIQLGMIFLRMDWGGEPGFGHGGNFPGFATIFWVLPRSRVAMFVSVMDESPSVSLLEALSGSRRFQPKPDVHVGKPVTNVGVLFSFLEHFGARERPTIDRQKKTAAYEGVYVSQWRAYRSIEKVLLLADAGEKVLDVRTSDDGSLVFNGKDHYQPIAEGVFWKPLPEDMLSLKQEQSNIWAFRREGDAMFATPRMAISSYRRVGWAADPRLHVLVIGALVVVLLTGAAAMLWRVSTAGGVWARRLAVALPLPVLATPLALLEIYPNGNSLRTDLLAGHTLRFALTLGFSNLTILLACALAVFALNAWRQSMFAPTIGGHVSRVHLTIVAIAGIGLAGFYLHYGLLGWTIPAR